jgi:hypothetical protein
MQKIAGYASSGFFVFAVALFFRFKIKDDIKAARVEATKAYRLYVEEPKTSPRKCRFDLEFIIHS